jgi:hypothetical protein
VDNSGSPFLKTELRFILKLELKLQHINVTLFSIALFSLSPYTLSRDSGVVTINLVRTGYRFFRFTYHSNNFQPIAINYNNVLQFY